jgi:hypothetical protein
MKMRKSQAGTTLLETAFASLITAVIAIGITGVTQQNQKGMTTENFRMESQQTGRAVLDRISGFVRGAGANRASAFSSAPYTTTSSLPVPSASSSSIRLRTDANDDGVVSGSTEDVSVSWNSTTKILTLGNSQFPNVTQFSLRYYSPAGIEIVPPSGGWNIATDASVGTTLRSIARVYLTMELMSRGKNPTSRRYEYMTLSSDATINNQTTGS